MEVNGVFSGDIRSPIGLGRGSLIRNHEEVEALAGELLAGEAMNRPIRQ